MQALALGARHIVEEMNKQGHSLTAIVACGGVAKSALFRQSLADACNMPVLGTVEEDSVLSGSSILAAAAASGHPLSMSLVEQMTALKEEAVVLPRAAQVEFMDRKFAVFLRLAEDVYAYRRIMGS
jgi:ribulose kinase